MKWLIGAPTNEVNLGGIGDDVVLVQQESSAQNKLQDFFFDGRLAKRKPAPHGKVLAGHWENAKDNVTRGNNCRNIGDIRNSDFNLRMTNESGTADIPSGAWLLLLKEKQEVAKIRPAGVQMPPGINPGKKFFWNTEGSGKMDKAPLLWRGRDMEAITAGVPMLATANSKMENVANAYQERRDFGKIYRSLREQDRTGLPVGGQRLREEYKKNCRLAGEFLQKSTKDMNLRTGVVKAKTYTGGHWDNAKDSATRGNNHDQLFVVHHCEQTGPIAAKNYPLSMKIPVSIKNLFEKFDVAPQMKRLIGATNEVNLGGIDRDDVVLVQQESSAQNTVPPSEKNSLQSGTSNSLECGGHNSVDKQNAPAAAQVGVVAGGGGGGDGGGASMRGGSCCRGSSSSSKGKGLGDSSTVKESRRRRRADDHTVKESRRRRVDDDDDDYYAGGWELQYAIDWEFQYYERKDGGKGKRKKGGGKGAKGGGKGGERGRETAGRGRRR